MKSVNSAEVVLLMAPVKSNIYVEFISTVDLDSAFKFMEFRHQISKFNCGKY